MTTCGNSLDFSNIRRRKSKNRSSIVHLKQDNNKLLEIEKGRESCDELIEVADFDDGPDSPPEVCLNILDLLGLHSDFPEKENVENFSSGSDLGYGSASPASLYENSHSSFRVTDTVLPPVVNQAFCFPPYSPNAESEDEKSSTNHPKISAPNRMNDLLDLGHILKKTLVISCEKLDLDKFCKKHQFIKCDANTILMRPPPVKEHQSALISSMKTDSVLAEKSEVRLSTTPSVVKITSDKIKNYVVFSKSSIPDTSNKTGSNILQGTCKLSQKIIPSTALESNATQSSITEGRTVTVPHKIILTPSPNNKPLARNVTNSLLLNSRLNYPAKAVQSIDSSTSATNSLVLPPADEHDVDDINLCDLSGITLSEKDISAILPNTVFSQSVVEGPPCDIDASDACIPSFNKRDRNQISVLDVHGKNDSYNLINKTPIHNDKNPSEESNILSDVLRLMSLCPDEMREEEGDDDEDDDADFDECSSPVAKTNIGFDIIKEMESIMLNAKSTKTPPPASKFEKRNKKSNSAGNTDTNSYKSQNQSNGSTLTETSLFGNREFGCSRYNAELDCLFSSSFQDFDYSENIMNCSDDDEKSDPVNVPVFAENDGKKSPIQQEPEIHETTEMQQHTKSPVRLPDGSNEPASVNVQAVPATSSQKKITLKIARKVKKNKMSFSILGDGSDSDLVNKQETAEDTAQNVVSGNDTNSIAAPKKKSKSKLDVKRVDSTEPMTSKPSRHKANVSSLTDKCHTKKCKNKLNNVNVDSNLDNTLQSDFDFRSNVTEPEDDVGKKCKSGHKVQNRSQQKGKRLNFPTEPKLPKNQGKSRKKEISIFKAQKSKRKFPIRAKPKRRSIFSFCHWRYRKKDSSEISLLKQTTLPFTPKMSSSKLPEAMLMAESKDNDSAKKVDGSENGAKRDSETVDVSCSSKTDGIGADNDSQGNNISNEVSESITSSIGNEKFETNASSVSSHQTLESEKDKTDDSCGLSPSMLLHHDETTSQSNGKPEQGVNSVAESDDEGGGDTAISNSDSFICESDATGSSDSKSPELDRVHAEAINVSDSEAKESQSEMAEDECVHKSEEIVEKNDGVTDSFASSDFTEVKENESPPVTVMDHCDSGRDAVFDDSNKPDVTKSSHEPESVATHSKNDNSMDCENDSEVGTDASIELLDSEKVTVESAPKSDEKNECSGVVSDKTEVNVAVKGDNDQEDMTSSASGTDSKDSTVSSTGDSIEVNMTKGSDSNSDDKSLDNTSDDSNIIQDEDNVKLNSASTAANKVKECNVLVNDIAKVPARVMFNQKMELKEVRVKRMEIPLENEDLRTLTVNVSTLKSRKRSISKTGSVATKKGDISLTDDIFVTELEEANKTPRSQRSRVARKPYSPTEEAPPARIQTPEIPSKVPTPSSAKKIKYSPEDVIKPFSLGWMREVVHRATTGSTKKGKAIDIYYFTPEGTKLRSMPDVSKYLAEHKINGLSIDNFTFCKETIYRYPFEKERGARVRYGDGSDGAPVTVATPSKPKNELETPKSSKLSKTQATAKQKSNIGETAKSQSAEMSSKSRTGTPNSKTRPVDSSKTRVSDSSKTRSVDKSKSRSTSVSTSRNVETTKSKGSSVLKPGTGSTSNSVEAPKAEISDANKEAQSVDSSKSRTAATSKTDVNKNSEQPSQVAGVKKSAPKTARKTMRATLNIPLECNDSEVPSQKPVAAEKISEPSDKNGEQQPKVSSTGSADKRLRKSTKRFLEEADSPAKRAKATFSKKQIPNLSRPCSSRCQVALHQLPSLQCKICLCMFHPQCVANYTVGLVNFTCQSCVNKRTKVGSSPDQLEVGPAESVPSPSILPIVSLQLFPEDALKKKHMTHTSDSYTPQLPPPPPLQKAPDWNLALVKQVDGLHCSVTSLPPNPSAVTPPLVVHPYVAPQLVSSTLPLPSVEIGQHIPYSVSASSVILSPSTTEIACQGMTSSQFTLSSPANVSSTVAPNLMIVSPLITNPTIITGAGSLVSTCSPYTVPVNNGRTPAGNVPIRLLVPISTTRSEIKPTFQNAPSQFNNKKPVFAIVKNTNDAITSVNVLHSSASSYRSLPVDGAKDDPIPCNSSNSGPESALSKNQCSFDSNNNDGKDNDSDSDVVPIDSDSDVSTVISTKSSVTGQDVPQSAVGKVSKTSTVGNTKVKSSVSITDSSSSAPKSTDEAVVTSVSSRKTMISSTAPDVVMSSLTPKLVIPPLPARLVVSPSVSKILLSPSVSKVPLSTSTPKMMFPTASSTSKGAFVSSVAKMVISPPCLKEAATPTSGVTSVASIKSTTTRAVSKATGTIDKGTNPTSSQKASASTYPNSGQKTVSTSPPVASTSALPSKRSMLPRSAKRYKVQISSESEPSSDWDGESPGPSFSSEYESESYGNKPRKKVPNPATATSERKKRSDVRASDQGRRKKRKASVSDSDNDIHSDVVAVKKNRPCVKTSSKAVDCNIVSFAYPAFPKNLDLNTFTVGYDCLNLIFKKLRINDLLQVSQVSQSWQHLSSQRFLWERISLQNVNVKDWIRCSESLKRNGTKVLNLGSIHIDESRDMWKEFANGLDNLTSIEHLTFGQVPPFILEAVADKLSLLQILECFCLTTTHKRPDLWTTPCKLKFFNLRFLRKLRRLKIRSAGGLLSETPPTELRHLSNLQHLSLTSLKEFPSSYFGFVSYLPNLVSLELGDCSSWMNENYINLSKLKKLQQLRLENGGGFDVGLGDALKLLEKLEELELVKFVIPKDLGVSIMDLAFLNKLILWPDNSKEAAQVNYNTFRSVGKVKQVSYFCWGIISPDCCIPLLPMLKDNDEDSNSDTAGGDTEEVHYEDMFDRLCTLMPDAKVEMKCISEDFLNEYCSIQR